MVTHNASANAKFGIYLAHAALALGVIILLLGLKLHGPSSFMLLEGMALSFYGLVASLLEALLPLIEKRPWFIRYVDFRMEKLGQTTFIPQAHGRLAVR